MSLYYNCWKGFFAYQVITKGFVLAQGLRRKTAESLQHPAIRLSLATNIFTIINCIYTIMPCPHSVFHLISSHRLISLSRSGLGLQMSSLHISKNLYTARKLVLVIFQLSYYGMMIFIVLSIRLLLSYISRKFSPHFMPSHQYTVTDIGRQSHRPVIFLYVKGAQVWDSRSHCKVPFRNFQTCNNIL